MVRVAFALHLLKTLMNTIVVRLERYDAKATEVIRKGCSKKSASFTVLNVMREHWAWTFAKFADLLPIYERFCTVELLERLISV